MQVIAGKRPLNLLWRRSTLDLVPEAYFIKRVLLGALGRPVRTLTTETLQDAPFLDDLLAVSMTNEFASYFEKARGRGIRNLMVLHLGDEHGTADRAFYADVDLVLRNYWFDEIMSDPRVVWVPNGYALGVGPASSLLPASRRSVAGFFAGAIALRTLSDERRAMRQAIIAANLPFRLHLTATPRHRLGPLAYAAALGDARFALVPGGNSPETIRLYEALEMGSIPIMLRSRFVEAADALGNPPFLLIDEWRELAQIYGPLAGEDPATLAAVDSLQRDVIGWWTAFKQHQQHKLRVRIGQLLGD